MRRSWRSTIVLIGVIGILTAAFALMFDMQRQLSRAERDRMQKRAESDAQRIAADLDRETQNTYFNFRMDAATWKSLDWSEFNARYDRWKEKTEYPDLIREFAFFPRDASEPVLVFDPSQKAFLPKPVDAELADLRLRAASEETLKPFYGDKCALMLPVNEIDRSVGRVLIQGPVTKQAISHMSTASRYGTLAIFLDLSVIKEKLLPDLSEKYFPQHEYNVRMVNTVGVPVFQTAPFVGEPDTSAPVFTLSPDNMIFVSNRETINSVTIKQGDGSSITRTENISNTAPPANVTNRSFRLELQQGEPAGPGANWDLRTRSITPSRDDNTWGLDIQHSAGSIDKFIAGESRNELLVYSSVYLLLVASILAIAISAMRSTRFAQRQVDFVSSISHEFRTPIAVIYSAGENLADGVTKHENQIHRYGELIKSEGQKLSAMVEQILEFAGADSGKRKYNFESAQAKEIVDDAIKECGPILDAAGFSVVTRIADHLPALSVDRSALSRAVQNLIANSVKYSNGSKWIRVSASNGGGIVKISVEDKGIGIAPSDIKFVFQPFYRASYAVDAQIHGNGLGLSLVSEIAKAHGGKVTVQSEEGRGSTFTIEIKPCSERNEG